MISPSKNAVFGPNSLTGFWTRPYRSECLYLLDSGRQWGGPKSGQGKWTDLDGLRYDQLDFLLCMLSESLHLCSCSGRLRTVEGVRSDLTLTLNLIEEEIKDDKLPKLLKPIRSHIDDLLVPFHQVERIHTELLELMPEQIIDALALSWHHDQGWPFDTTCPINLMARKSITINERVNIG